MNEKFGDHDKYNYFRIAVIVALQFWFIVLFVCNAVLFCISDSLSRDFVFLDFAGNVLVDLRGA